MVREILAVKRRDLFKNKEFLGFLPLDKSDFLLSILKNFEYKERSSLEDDSSHKQIIPYVWLVNRKAKKVFVYKRAVTGSEARLHNKYSGGVGGHIDKDTEINSQDPIFDAMMRELKEELVMNNYPAPKIVGFINDESDAVNSVHFGVVAIAETEEEAKPAEDMASGEFYSIQDIEGIFSNPENNIENWTKLSWPFVKEYLSK